MAKQDYEDVNIGNLVYIGGLSVLGVVVIVLGLQVLYYNYRESIEAGPAFNEKPAEVAGLQADQEGSIQRYGWVNQQEGVTAIPIGRAQELVIKELASGVPAADLPGSQAQTQAQRPEPGKSPAPGTDEGSGNPSKDAPKSPAQGSVEAKALSNERPTETPSGQDDNQAKAEESTPPPAPPESKQTAEDGGQNTTEDAGTDEEAATDAAAMPGAEQPTSPQTADGDASPSNTDTDTNSEKPAGEVNDGEADQSHDDAHADGAVRTGDAPPLPPAAAGDTPE